MSDLLKWCRIWGGGAATDGVCTNSSFTPSTRAAQTDGKPITRGATRDRDAQKGAARALTQGDTSARLYSGCMGGEGCKGM